MAGLKAREMEYEAKVMYEALASSDAPGYTSRQWSILLTQAQEKVLREIISEGWDRSETNRRIVSKLIKSDEFTEFVKFKLPNSYEVAFPTDYMHIITDYAEGVMVSPKDWDFIMRNMDNPFEKPYTKEYWRITSSAGAILITNGDAPKKYYLTYIKRPEPIITKQLEVGIEGFTNVNDCKLDPVAHRRIVERAARLAEAYTNNQLGYQLGVIEEQSTK